MSKPMTNKPVVSRRTITKGQAALYDLTVERVAAQKAITLDEAIEIYSTKVCRNYVNGKPAGYVWRFDETKDRYTTSLEPLNELDLQQRSMQWLMQSIGSLVMKGYLKVTPMIELGD